MDAMAAADRRRQLVLEGALFQRGEQGVDIGDEEVGRLHELEVETGVKDVGRRHPLMQEAGLRPYFFRDRGEEGDDIVLHLALDFIDAGDLEIPAIPDGLRRLLRNEAELGHRLRRQGLDLEPDAESGFRLPDASHFGSAVAGNHACVRGPVLAQGKLLLSRATMRAQTGAPHALI